MNRSARRKSKVFVEEEENAKEGGPTSFQLEFEPKKNPISKLIFQEALEEKQEKQQAAALTMNIRETKKPRSLRRGREMQPFKAESSILKPSFMSWTNNDEIDYDSFTKCESMVVRKTSHKQPEVSHQPLLKPTQTFSSFSLFDDFLQESSNVKIDTSKNEILAKLHAKERSPIKQIDKQSSSQIFQDTGDSGFYFQMEEPEPKQMEKSLRLSSRKGKRSALKEETVNNQQEDDKLENIQKEQNETSKQQFFINFDESKPVQAGKYVNLIIQQDNSIDARLYFYNIFKEQNSEGISQLMSSPIPEGHKISFDLIVIFNLVEKKFQLKLDFGDKLQTIMKAEKYMRLNRTQYQFFLFLPSYNQFVDFFKITSNLERTEFEMSCQETVSNKKRTRILGNITNLTTKSGEKSLIMYYPGFNSEENTPHRFYKFSEKGLQHLYRDPNYHNQISYLMTGKIDRRDRLLMMTEHGFKTSAKSMQFRDVNNNMRVIIGKKGSKRYKILVGPGHSPMEIFALAVVQIET